MKDLRRDFYEFLTEDDDTDVCKDLDNDTCSELPFNFFRLLLAQLMSKLADALSNPKIVLPWIMTNSGIPTFFSGFLVPIRESGSLLPQIFIRSLLSERPTEKHYYFIGAVIQAVFLLLILASAVYLTGVWGGVAILLCLCGFSLARAVCSISLKNTLAKTIPKKRRGRLTGLAASISGAVTIAIAMLILFGVATRGTELIMLGLAAACWVAAGLSVASAAEPESSDTQAVNFSESFAKIFELLKDDVVFRRFLLVRALLVGSGLSAPFFVIASQIGSERSDLYQLAFFMLLSGVASASSGYIWGKLADSDSRKAMGRAALLMVICCAFAALASYFSFAGQFWIFLSLFFVSSIAHQGARVGRKTYVLDISSDDNRSDYVATSNTFIGVILLVFGVLSAGLAQLSLATVFVLFGVTSLAALALSIKLSSAE